MDLDIKTVLVSTDFSELGDRAIPYAFRLAKDHGAAVILVHVLEAAPTPNPLYAHYYPIPTPEQVKKAESAAMEELRRRVPEEHRRRASAAVDTRVMHGEPSLEILRIAGEKKASLIVISTHGRTGLQHLALGSVAERVIRRAHCPVLVVR